MRFTHYLLFTVLVFAVGCGSDSPSDSLDEQTQQEAIEAEDAAVEAAESKQ